MGAWGPAISSNDMYEDVFSDFMCKYDEGMEVNEIIEYIKSSFGSDGLCEDEANNFWFALAKAQWEVGALDTLLFEKIKESIEDGSELKRWEELNAELFDIRKREKALKTFLQKLSIPKPKPRKRKKIVLRDSIFKTGDCLSVKFEDDMYGAVLVLYHEEQTEFGLNGVLILDYFSNEPPQLDIFESGCEAPNTRIENHYFTSMNILYAKPYKKCALSFTKICELEIPKKFEVKDFKSYSYQWEICRDAVDLSGIEDKQIVSRVQNSPKRKVSEIINGSALENVSPSQRVGLFR